GRPCVRASLLMFIVISIHALRVEGDAYPGTKCVNKLYFYPRPPGGGRLATKDAQAFTQQISIHALRVEGDSKNGQNFRLFLRKREKNLPL
ncbi:hypothetical protein, partial [Hominenteromicrobium sp.]|uniref:hypothetical protein n=1 Tax=Hominenteromicrobium sp. TaxID=3073581 RepID=UPI003AB70C14